MAERDETSPLAALTASWKAVGLKQVRRAVCAGRSVRVYLACDADPSVTEPILALCVDDVLYVVYTERGKAIRLISARRATKRERMYYYDNKNDFI